jgi:hypothetical protein
LGRWTDIGYSLGRAPGAFLVGALLQSDDFEEVRWLSDFLNARGATLRG